MDLEHATNIADKRVDVRYDLEAAISWSYFNRETHFNGKILNFSAGGVYIETAHEIKAGSTIYIHVERISSRKFDFSDHRRPRFVTLGEVRWCNELSGLDRSRYGAGIRFPFTEYA